MTGCEFKTRTVAVGSVLAALLVAGCQGDSSPEVARTTSTSDTSPSTASPASPEVDPGPPRYVSQVVDVAPSAAEIVDGFGSLWVQSHRTHTITRLEPGSGRVVAEIVSKGTNLVGLAAGAGHIWYLDSPTGRIEGIDPESNKVTVEITIPNEEGGGFEAVDDEVWFAGTSRALYRIGPAGKITGKVRLPSSGAPLWPTVVGDRVFVTDPDARRVYVVDRTRLELTRRVRLEGDVAFGDAGFGSVWVGAFSGPLYRLDAVTGAVQATVDVASADHVSACGQRVWVRVSDREIVGIDPGTNRIVKTYELPTGEIPGGGFLCQSGALWVTNWTDATVWKIPTRT